MMGLPRMAAPMNVTPRGGLENETTSIRRSRGLEGGGGPAGVHQIISWCAQYKDKIIEPIYQCNIILCCIYVYF